MAERPEYKSIWTGQQVDEAVGKIIGDGATPLTTADIVQTQGTSPNKVMSQGAVTQSLKALPTAAVVDDKIATHNTSQEAHPYILDLVAQKPNALNERSQSQQDTYSANYINNSFAPLTFVSNLYAEKTGANTASLMNTPPVLNADNVLTSTNTTNTEYNWSVPDFTFTRELGVATTLTSSNSFQVNMTLQVSRNANISWGAKIKVSQDGGENWEYISENQSYGAVFFETGLGNTTTFNVFTNLIQGTVTYPIGTLLSVEIYKKQSIATALTTTIYCGVEVDGAGIYTFVQFNFANVHIGTNQIDDGSVTFPKLSDDVQKRLNDTVTNYYQVSISSYTALTDKEPFLFSSQAQLPFSIGTTTVIELINNDPILYANYGFQIASIENSSITIYMLAQPTSTTTLTIGVRG